LRVRPWRRRCRRLAARILIVEDDEAVLETLHAILDRAGYQVEQATDLRQALAAIERSVFDVAVLDLRLGEDDGLTVLRHLKEKSPGAAGLILTGFGSLETAVQALRAGAFDFLVKPVDPDEVKAAIAKSQDAHEQLDNLTVLNTSLRQLSQDRDVLRHVAEDRADRLEELDRLKEEFIATASHELKGPLTSIRGFAQLLLRTVDEPQPKREIMAQGLATIDAQSALMARLIDDLLDASRLQAGAFELRKAACELAGCLSAVLARMSEDQRQRVDVMLPGGPLVGEWEQIRIEQVLANLVGNALKYSPDTERVSVTAERGNGDIEVVVGDRGMGIPSNELPRLFERFHRTPQAMASGLPGTGLGLYICRGIVVAHGGRLWAESPGEGQGAAFRFTLPTASLEQTHT